MSKIVFLFITLLLVITAKAENYQIDTQSSKVSWQLHISSDTEVYGNVNLEGDTLKLSSGQITGGLRFKLIDTKSYELDGEKKEWSSSRDSRIYDITGAKKHSVIFTFSKITGLNSMSAKGQKVTISGKLSLNGVTRDISIPGSIDLSKSQFVFSGDYQLNWNDFKVANPVMWFLRAVKKADKEININFMIKANAVK